MAKAFAIVRMVGGTPDIGELPYHGYALAAQFGQAWGAYLFSGTAAQLQAINALPQVYGICAVTEGGAVLPNDTRGLDVPQDYPRGIQAHE